MKKTSLYLTDTDLARLRRLAGQEGRGGRIQLTARTVRINCS